MIKKIKKGFTLSEVLIAMSLIGVISALVVPQLVKSTQKDKTGAILGRAVEQIETGCQNMLQDYNNRNNNDIQASITDTLTAMDGNFAFTFARLSSYIGATQNAANYQFNKFPATMIAPAALQNVNSTNPTDIIAQGIIIDTNGIDNRPNQSGRDQFVFDLRNNGKLVPRGIGLNTCEGESPAAVNENCTARVVRDGFKIKYNW